jgi:hypothetical protein
MSKLLVKFDRDWADEFSVYGFAILNEKQYEQLIEWAKEATYNFGSNEGWDEEDISDGFSFEAVSDEEIRVLNKLFNPISCNGYPSWGNFPDFVDGMADKLYEEYDIEYRDDVIEVLHNGELVFTATSYSEADNFVNAEVMKRMLD